MLLAAADACAHKPATSPHVSAVGEHCRTAVALDRQPRPAITWIGSAERDQQARLREWCAMVGPVLLRTPAAPCPRRDDRSTGYRELEHARRRRRSRRAGRRRAARRLHARRACRRGGAGASGDVPARRRGARPRDHSFSGAPAHRQRASRGACARRAAGGARSRLRGALRSVDAQRRGC